MNYALWEKIFIFHYFRNWLKVKSKDYFFKMELMIY